MSVDDDLVMFVADSHSFVDLDRSGSELWAALHAGSMDAEVVVTHLLRTYGLDPDHAAAVTADFLTDLERLGVIAPSAETDVEPPERAAPRGDDRG